MTFDLDCPERITQGGIILTIGGVCQGYQGMVALFNDEFYVTTQNWVLKFRRG